MNVGSIEAVLTLNSEQFNTGLTEASNLVNNFATAITKLNNGKPVNAIQELSQAIILLNTELDTLNFKTKSLNDFSKMANAVKKTAQGLEILSKDTVDVVTGINTMNNIFKAFQGTLNGTEVTIKGVASSVNALTNTERQDTYSIEENSRAMMKNAEAKLRAIGYTGELSTSEGREASSHRQNSSAVIQEAEAVEMDTVAKQQNINATNQASISQNRMAGASKGLRGALSSLKMMGTMVASMLAYNFAHKLLVATGETIHAKSEMEGYFKMLRFGQGDINKFNSALDDTVARFQRVNKYSLGETISSIGVEFNLTTDEMIKAMDVTSMITSEYLRAGRNVNEASLAVKDVLQGQFQRLSRETGVGAEELKEAGWSGDNTDVMSLLDALRKVGEGRHWDVFAEKANSLNDILLISQNRFGEWSAEMVNIVQPAILNTFNSFMSFAGGVSQALGSAFKWLNSNGWTQSAVKIGAVATAILTLMPVLTAYRGGVNLLQASQLGLTKSLASLVLGVNAETLATSTSAEAILMKILGIEAEKLGEDGLVGAINASILAKQAETLATAEGTVANVGFTGGLMAMVAGETLAEGSTIGLSGAIGILSGAFLASPIGWFTLAVVGLASAFYVLSGGLDSSWGKMQKFNEAMSDPDATMTAQTKRLERLKKNVGETSEEYTNAKESVDDFYTHLQSAKAMYDTAQEDYESVDSVVRSSTKKILQANGLDEGTAKKFVARYGYLEQGKREYYEADQVLNKQILSSNSNFAKDYDALVKKMDVNSDEFKDASEKLVSNYENLAEHSYLANTAEDWWTWLWNSFYAGIDQFWIDWDKFWADPNWDTFGEVFGKPLLTDDIVNSIRENGLIQTIIDAWNDSAEVDALETAFENMIAKPFRDWVSWFLSDPLANLDVIGDDFDESLGKLLFGNDSDTFSQIVRDYLADKFNLGVSNFMTDFNNDPVGTLGLTASATTSLPLLELIKKLLLGENTKVSLWDILKDVLVVSNPLVFLNSIIEQVRQAKLDFIGAIIDALLPDTASASDGSSDHPSFMEDLSDILGFDVQSWIDSFNSDPIGTLGLNAKLDIGALFNNLLPTGGVNIGEWLNNSFNLDNVVSSFNNSLSGMVSSASTTSLNIGGLFGGMRGTIQGHMSNIINNTTTGFENVKTGATTRITQMRDSVSNVIHQMTNAWVHMKDSIVNSAKLIYEGVKDKFDKVKQTLKDFFTKLQNPSQWGGAGQRSWSKSPRPATARKLFSPVITRGGTRGAGVNPYSSPNQMVELSELINMVGGANKVNLSDFLSLFTDGGFGGWDFHSPSKTHIFNTGKAWKSAPAVIKGFGSVGNGYEVSKFWDGSDNLHLTWNDFMATAEAIFSQIPYKFYYNSEWKGSWLGALLSGALNCSDGADALINLARVFGFDGYKQHTTLANGVGHFFTVINGKKLDTTHFQNSGSWSPLGGAGVPVRSSSRGAGTTTTKTVNITNDFTGAVIYGIDDLDAKIKESTKEAMREEFNDSFALPV